MLAYVFWHRPRQDADVQEYEQAQIAFHRSLQRSPPAGLRASALFAISQRPWETGSGDPARPEDAETPASYEDWYLVEDFASLGVLGEAAVGRGHRTPHEAAARSFADGTAGLYGLLEGGGTADALGAATLAAWVARAPGSKVPAGSLAELLGDGIDPALAGLWRRQLTLGPAPELCLLAAEAPPGIAPSRLPAGWSARVYEREVRWHG